MLAKFYEVVKEINALVSGASSSGAENMLKELNRAFIGVFEEVCRMDDATKNQQENSARFHQAQKTFFELGACLIPIIYGNYEERAKITEQESEDTGAASLEAQAIIAQKNEVKAVSVQTGTAMVVASGSGAIPKQVPSEKMEVQEEPLTIVQLGYEKYYKLMLPIFK